MLKSLFFKFSESESLVMAGSTRNNLKDKLEDGELDLSMMQYNDVPVKVLLGCKGNDRPPLLCRR